MKKKIRYLTIEEINNICDKHNHCSDCPLNTNIEYYCKTDILNGYGDEEIEVEEIETV